MKNLPKKVLVLGGCGFIGKHICKHLINDGVQLAVFDTSAEQLNSNDECNFINGNLFESDKIEKTIAQHKITHVIHLISTTLPKSSNENKPFDVSSNVVQTIHLLDLCVKYKIEKILFMSSGGTIYGTPDSIPINEKHVNNPICSYGITKLTIEKYLFLYHHLYGLNYVSLRAANPYGPGQNPLSNQGIIANFVHRMHAQQPLEVWGDGSTIRDFFDVRDLTSITKTALFSGETGVFNAGSGTGTSINQLISILKDIVKLPSDVIYKEQRGFDVPAIVLDCTAAEKKLGWRSKIDLKTGIIDYIKWYQENFHNINLSK